MRKTGFTLLELSVVLVIIALIVGGILAGKEMIEAALVRKQVTQLEHIATAERVFELKYNGVAGDMCANNFGFTCGNASPYMDNGVIEDQNGKTVDNGGVHEMLQEPIDFFVQLWEAGLYEHTIICSNPFGEEAYFYPAINSSAAMIAVTHLNRIWIFLGMNQPDPTCINFNNISGSATGGIMTPAQAFALDVKMDDGVPGTGIFFATTLTGNELAGAIDTTPGRCVVDVTATHYNVNNTQRDCRILTELQ